MPSNDVTWLKTQFVKMIDYDTCNGSFVGDGEWNQSVGELISAFVPDQVVPVLNASQAIVVGRAVDDLLNL